LALFPFLHARVSLKGCTEEEFARLTGADPKSFHLQLASLVNLLNAGVSAHPAVMLSAMEILSLSSPVYQMSWSESIEVPLIFSIICWKSFTSIAIPDAPIPGIIENNINWVKILC
jgi:hypothetical protein